MLPTDAELEILGVLWERGPCTVRDVHEALVEKGVAYTTILKLMQIMHEKDLVDRDTTDRSHVYRARVQRERTQRELVRDLADRAFGGSAAALVQRALAAKPATAAELKEIRTLLSQLEHGQA
jgi:BlaI family transcriptional regulator, penicillinase repressor